MPFLILPPLYSLDVALISGYTLFILENGVGEGGGDFSAEPSGTDKVKRYGS